MIAGEQHAFPLVQQPDGREHDVADDAGDRNGIFEGLAFDFAQAVELVEARQADARAARGRTPTASATHARPIAATIAPTTIRRVTLRRTASPAARTLEHRSHQIVFRKIGPLDVGHDEFRIGGLIEQKVGEPPFAARADQQIELRQVRRVQIPRDQRLRRWPRARARRRRRRARSARTARSISAREL